jgi:hypothetical protein
VDDTEVNSVNVCDDVDFLFILTATSTFSQSQWEAQKTFFSRVAERIDVSRSRSDRLLSVYLPY